MTTSIINKVDTSVVDGPKFSETTELAVEAFDVVNIAVGAGESTTADVQPGGEGQIRFLLIKASAYDKLWYKVADNYIELDVQQGYTGKGITAALGSPVQTIEFKNDGDAAVDIVVLVGRMATPSNEGDDSDSDATPGDEGGTDTDSGDSGIHDTGTDAGDTDSGDSADNNANPGD
ncbi:MAG: hypothetical protein R3293_06840 [Candidatus Promineifilaceae bacterium]|nr:hypothetical protein [Candidatus Promineifilaceae bacterium]